MEITTKEMTMPENSFNKSNNDYYLFHELPKKTAPQLFKEVPCIIYVTNCLECKFQKFRCFKKYFRSVNCYSYSIRYIHAKSFITRKALTNQSTRKV